MQMEFEIRNRMLGLPEIHRRIDAMRSEWGLSEEASQDLKLVLEEVVSNIIKYAYTDRECHSIRVRASQAGAHVKLEIIDDGKPFDPLSMPAPDLTIPIHERPPGGLGIYLAKVLTDSIEYRRDWRGNVLTLLKAM